MSLPFLWEFHKVHHRDAASRKKQNGRPEGRPCAIAEFG